MPVLAVLAMEVASNTPQRIRQGAGKVMEQGFLLDRIDCLGADLPVGLRKKGSPLVFPDPADPVLSLFYGAAMVTERAGHRGIPVLFVLESLMHNGS
jgi:hypothetical protein